MFKMRLSWYSFKWRHLLEVLVFFSRETTVSSQDSRRINQLNGVRFKDPDMLLYATNKEDDYH